MSLGQAESKTRDHSPQTRSPKGYMPGMSRERKYPPQQRRLTSPNLHDQEEVRVVRMIEQGELRVIEAGNKDVANMHT